MRTKLIFMLQLTLIVIFFFCSGTVQAAEYPKIYFESGFNGISRLGGINPFVVTVETGSEAVQGTLKLDVGGAGFAWETELAPHSKKSFRFQSLLPEADARIAAEFFQHEERIAANEEALVVVPEKSVMIGVLSEKPEELFYFKNACTEVFSEREIKLINLKQDLPYSAEELDNLCFILVEDFAMETLSGASCLAMQEWIGRGNCLLAGAGGRSYKNLTGMLEGIKEPLRYGQGWIVPVQEGLGNLSSESVGPVLEKHLTSYILSKTLAGKSFREIAREAPSLSNVIENRLRPSGKRSCFILSVVFIYLLALTFTGLAKEKKSWLVSMVVLGFGLLFLVLSGWGLGGFYDGAAASLNLYHKMENYSAVGLYPQKPAELEAVLPGVSCPQLNCDCSYRFDGTEARAIVRADTDMPVYFFGRGSLDRPAYRNSLRLSDDGQVTGLLKNPLVDKMQDCFLLLGDTLINIGVLDGREEVRVQYSLDHKLKGLGDYNYLQSLCAAAGLESGRNRLFEYYFYELADFPPGGALIGFSYGTVGVKVNNKKRDLPAVVLNIFEVELSGEEEGVYLPYGVVRPVVNPGDNKEYKGILEYMLEEGKEIKAYYVLPLGIQAKEVLFDYSPAPDALLEIYNRAGRTWESFQDSRLAGQRLDDCVGSGPLAVKIKGDGRVVLPRISVKGSYQK